MRTINLTLKEAQILLEALNDAASHCETTQEIIDYINGHSGPDPGRTARKYTELRTELERRIGEEKIEYDLTEGLDHQEANKTG